VMDHEERYAALEACKWVDEIIPNVPYDLSEEWVNALIRDHRIDYILHGDDPCITADGKDAYAYAKALGVYKQVKRTEGVSTTDIVGRMLLMTREHHVPPAPAVEAPGDARIRSPSLRSSSLSAAAASGSREVDRDDASDASSDAAGERSRMKRALASLPAAAAAKFLPTARRLMQFADGRQPKAGDRVVYVCGGWDLFNAGHIAALQEARKLGDFLLVGIHDDALINRMRGKGLPILNLYERALSLLSCKYVDEIIIGAPWYISEDMITTMNIAVVAKGARCGGPPTSNGLAAC
jgi:ethanolamine-phosphate cytidylyltransferase